MAHDFCKLSNRVLSSACACPFSMQHARFSLTSFGTRCMLEQLMYQSHQPRNNASTWNQGKKQSWWWNITALQIEPNVIKFLPLSLLNWFSPLRASECPQANILLMEPSSPWFHYHAIDGTWSASLIMITNNALPTIPLHTEHLQLSRSWYPPFATSGTSKRPGTSIKASTSTSLVWLDLSPQVNNLQTLAVSNA